MTFTPGCSTVRQVRRQLGKIERDPQDRESVTVRYHPARPRVGVLVAGIRLGHVAFFTFSNAAYAGIIFLVARLAF